MNAATTPTETTIKTNTCAPCATTTTARRDHVTPRADVLEGKTEYVLLLDLPGVATGDVTVELDRGDLVVEAVRYLGPAVEGGTRPSRRYRRTFGLPDTVDAKAISAGLDSGVLTLTLPKRAEAAAHRIPVS
jgi:HSP20 family protein